MQANHVESPRWQELVSSLWSRANEGGDWPSGLARACPEGGPDGIRLVRSVAGRLAWLATLGGAPVPRPAKGSGWDGRVSAWCFGERMRYEFAFSEIAKQQDSWTKRFPHDSLLAALIAFSGCGNGQEWGPVMVRQALAGTDADDRVRFVCLHAIWFALAGDPSMAPWLIELSEDMLARGEESDVLHYRRARALRVLGRSDEALEEVDEALSMLEPNHEAAKVARDFAGERGQVMADMPAEARVASLYRRLKTGI
ncbi:MAG: hypothetical protein ACRD0J_15870 [Acidimicrobiales bacterium]